MFFRSAKRFDEINKAAIIRPASKNCDTKNQNSQNGLKFPQGELALVSARGLEAEKRLRYVASFGDVTRKYGCVCDSASVSASASVACSL